MKKIYLSIATLFSVAMMYGQGFWTPTSYKGAFPVTDGLTGITSNDWTAGWCNFDPQSTNYPTTTVTVSSDITSNTTWTSTDVVLLQNKVYVTNGATLTIQAGCVIRGDKNSGGTLIISRGSKINAQGTVSNPIVFTSNEASGSRSLGDWGGIVILGSATNNQAGGVAVIEGGLDPVKAEYGGSNDSDSSGVLSFVRIEFGGIPFQVDKEINGLTMGSVGNKTKIDHVQCSFTNDDSFEWFGGTVNCKYLVAFRGLDDDFDTDFGFRGNIQFGLIVRDPSIADQSASSTSEGFESDNDGSGTEALPHTAPVFSNITLVGPYRGSTANTIDAKFRRALRLRRNTYTSVFNSIFTDFPTGLHIDGAAAEANALSDSLRFENNLLAGMPNGKNLQTGTSLNLRSWFNANMNDTSATVTSLIVNPYNFTSGDYRLIASSAAASGADFSDPFISSSGVIGLNEYNSSNMIAALYPNPASETFNLIFSSNSTGNATVLVLDLTGKTVLSENLNVVEGSKNKIQFNTSELTNGFYFVNVSVNGTSKTLKLLLNK